MLEEFLKDKDSEQRKLILQALAILEDFDLFNFILRRELEQLINSVAPEEPASIIHERISAFQAKQAFVTQLKLAIPKGD